jgi:hypothetical protein
MLPAQLRTADYERSSPFASWSCPCDPCGRPAVEVKGSLYTNCPIFRHCSREVLPNSRGKWCVNPGAPPHRERYHTRSARPAHRHRWELVDHQLLRRQARARHVRRRRWPRSRQARVNPSIRAFRSSPCPLLLPGPVWLRRVVDEHDESPEPGARPGGGFLAREPTMIRVHYAVDHGE